MIHPTTQTFSNTERIHDLRRRVREAMDYPPVAWSCPACIGDQFGGEPLPARKAQAIALNLSHMPADLWPGQMLAGSRRRDAGRRTSPSKGTGANGP